MAAVIAHDHEVVDQHPHLIRCRLARGLASQSVKRLVQHLFDSFHVALDLSIKRQHELSLLVVHQDITVVAIVLGRLLKDREIWSRTRLQLRLVLRQGQLKHVRKLRQILQFV